MANVKPRHAAALALVGWYLMLPPLQFVGPGNDPGFGSANISASPPTTRASRKNSDDRTAGGSFSGRDLRLGEHPSDLPHACVSLIPRQAAMANVNRLAQKENPGVLVWLKIYLIRLLPFPAAELTAQRCKNAHLPYPR